MWLKKRTSSILVRLIEIYTSTHKPVGSGCLAPGASLSCSAVRKELQELESQGYIFKPTTSGGRIPTNKGIKYYLKEVISNLEPWRENIQLPEIRMDDPDFNHISGNFLSLLADETHSIGFVFLHSIFDVNFRHLRLIKVGPNKVMALMQSLNNHTFSKILRTHENYSEKELKEWETILNREFKGRTLHNTFKSVRNRLFKEKEKYIKIYRGLYYLLGNEDLATTEFFFKGTLNILDTELVNPHKVKRLLQALEEKEKFSDFLGDIMKHNSQTRNAVIAFGGETGIADLEDFILIFSNFYYSRNPIGNIGVIGPKFMAYPNTISQVELYSSYISTILSKKRMEV